MVERLWVGCSSTELLQRLSHSNQRERERAHFCPFQVNSDSTIPVSSCISLSLSGSWSQVQNNSSAHWQRPSPSYTYTHSQPVLIIIHTFIDGHFSSCDPCWGHKPYPLVIVTHSLTHTHTHTSTSDVLTGQSSPCRHFILMTRPVTHSLFYREQTYIDCATK